MGTSQIILLVLSVILVGVSVSTGMATFTKQAKVAHRQAMIDRINELVTGALPYRKTPVSMGGGGQSFVGYTPSGAVESDHVAGNSAGGLKLVEEEVNYFIEWYFNDRLKIIASSKIYGEGNYWNNTYNARITAVFDNNGNIDADGYQLSGDWVDDF
jgi:hypothetical protein